VVVALTLVAAHPGCFFEGSEFCQAHSCRLNGIGRKAWAACHYFERKPENAYVGLHRVGSWAVEDASLARRLKGEVGACSYLCLCHHMMGCIG